MLGEGDSGEERYSRAVCYLDNSDEVFPRKVFLDWLWIKFFCRISLYADSQNEKIQNEKIARKDLISSMSSRRPSGINEKTERKRHRKCGGSNAYFGAILTSWVLLVTFERNEITP